MKKNNEKRLPRKLKKAAKNMLNYYDGVYLWFPRNERRTKAMYKLFWTYHSKGHDYYDYGSFKSEKFQRTKKGDILYEVLHDMFWTESVNYKGMTLKDHKKAGEIFVYYYAGCVYPGGAWVPKEKPKTYCTKGKNFQTGECFLYVNEYSYKTLKFEKVFEQKITEEEWNDKGKYEELLKKYKTNI